MLPARWRVCSAVGEVGGRRVRRVWCRAAGEQQPPAAADDVPQTPQPLSVVRRTVRRIVRRRRASPARRPSPASRPDSGPAGGGPAPRGLCFTRQGLSEQQRALARRIADVAPAAALAAPLPAWPKVAAGDGWVQAEAAEAAAAHDAAPPVEAAAESALVKRADPDKSMQTARSLALKQQRRRRDDWRQGDVHAAIAREQALLPVRQREAELLTAIGAHQVTVVTAETASGKSTQIPQMLLDRILDCGDASRGGCVLVTQPRRVAAVTLARRVAAELGEELGASVGYSVRLDRQAPKHVARISFETCGVLLRRMCGHADSTLGDVGYLILDDAHERDAGTDVTLALVRQALPHCPDLRVVLMSATHDSSTLRAFFEAAGVAVAEVHIPGRAHPVRELWLDDLPPEVAEACGEGSGAPPAGVAAAVEWVCAEIQDVHAGVLVFLPGVGELRAVAKSLTARAAPASEPLDIVLLHATAPAEEQQRAFAPPSTGSRRIVLATNCAESSITVPHVRAVVNSGRVNELHRDPSLAGATVLTEVWACHSAQEQRKGRAGRTAEGLCVHLFPKRIAAHFSAAAEPDMRRLPLAPVVLLAKAARLRPCHSAAAALRQCPVPPSAAAVAEGLAELRLLGALTPAGDGEELTQAGRCLAALPLPPRLARMLVASCTLGCVDACLTLCASDAVRGTLPPVAESSLTCDHAALHELFTQWEQGQGQGQGISREAGRHMQSLRQQLAGVLARSGLLPELGQADAAGRLGLGGLEQDRHGPAVLPLAAGFALAPHGWVRSTPGTHSHRLLRHGPGRLLACARTSVAGREKSDTADEQWWASVLSVVGTKSGHLHAVGLSRVPSLAPLILDPSPLQLVASAPGEITLVQGWRAWPLPEADAAVLAAVHAGFHERMSAVFSAGSPQRTASALTAAQPVMDAVVQLLLGEAQRPHPARLRQVPVSDLLAPQRVREPPSLPKRDRQTVEADNESPMLFDPSDAGSLEDPGPPPPPPRRRLRRAPVRARVEPKAARPDAGGWIRYGFGDQ